jgi:hypothetical protein
MSDILSRQEIEERLAWYAEHPSRADEFISERKALETAKQLGEWLAKIDPSGTATVRETIAALMAYRRWAKGEPS